MALAGRGLGSWWSMAERGSYPVSPNGGFFSFADSSAVAAIEYIFVGLFSRSSSLLARVPELRILVWKAVD